jgi:hypothetical protein
MWILRRERQNALKDGNITLFFSRESIISQEESNEDDIMEIDPLTSEGDCTEG